MLADLAELLQVLGFVVVHAISIPDKKLTPEK
jgi:hypothetical protein